MSVFYHNDAPLLHNTLFQTSMNSNNNLNDVYNQMYRQQIMMEMQQQNQVKDWVGDLDSILKNLDNSTIELLNNDIEFSSLSTQLQSLIQHEIMLLVKPKINLNNGAIDNIKKQMDIINNVNQKVKEEEKQNMNDLNDYIKNYSHLTFDEYRKLKSGVSNDNNDVITIASENNKKKVNRV